MFLKFGGVGSDEYLFGEPFVLAPDVGGGFGNQCLGLGVQAFPQSGEFGEIFFGGIEAIDEGGEGFGGGVDARREVGEAWLRGREFPGGLEFGELPPGVFEIARFAGEAERARIDLQPGRGFGEPGGQVGLGGDGLGEKVRPLGGVDHPPDGETAEGGGDKKQKGESECDASSNGQL